MGSIYLKHVIELKYGAKMRVLIRLIVRIYKSKHIRFLYNRERLKHPLYS